MEWLKTYFGEAFDKLSPQTMLENDDYAIVRIVGSMPVDFSNISIILIKKTQTYQNGARVVLGESWNTDVKDIAEEALRKAPSYF